MADRSIGELPKASEVQDDSLLVMEQQGQARSVTGELWKQYARESTAEYVEGARASAEAAEKSADAAAESARDAADVALHPPILKGGSDHWWIWDTEKNDYAESGADAGVSVRVSPDTVTGAPGSEAKVENVGTDTDPVLRFTLPRGETGEVSRQELESALAAKQDTLAFDTVPTAGSAKPVTSGGVYSAVQRKLGSNILDNWDFSNVVNQLGQTTYAANNNYGIDRWKTFCSPLTLEGGCVKLVKEAGSGTNTGAMGQIIERSSYYFGKKMTLSALLDDGTLHTGSGTCFVSGDPDYTAVNLCTDNAVSLNLQKVSGMIQVLIRVSANAPDGTSIKIAAVKLELGEGQTLAYQENGKWMLNEHSNYTLELLKCQRYQFVFQANAFFPATYLGADVAEIFIPLPVQLCHAPASFSVGFTKWNGAQQYPNEWTFLWGHQNRNGVAVRFQHTGHGLTGADGLFGSVAAGTVINANL